ncbi:MAG: ABC transporter ATP-binding protein [Lentisphaeria bacterium]|nr:ABC transporter ATP-binding protein [Lentisphaeria bacterium]
MTQAVVCHHLSFTYPNGHQGLHDLSLSIEQGEIFGFLGPNGAGKTTTIKLLLGLMKPTAGDLLVLGGKPAEPKTRAAIGYLPEVANYYDFLTIGELLSFYGALCGMSRQKINDRTMELAQLTGLETRLKTPLRQFSKGMLQRAGLCQALLHDPALLILDEPMTGLDPIARSQMRGILENLRKDGKTIFFSSHELSEAEIMCDRVGVLCDGGLRWHGPTRDMAGDGSENLERKFLKIISEGK